MEGGALRRPRSEQRLKPTVLQVVQPGRFAPRANQKGDKEEEGEERGRSSHLTDPAFDFLKFDPTVRN